MSIKQAILFGHAKPEIKNGKYFLTYNGRSIPLTKKQYHEIHKSAPRG